MVVSVGNHRLMLSAISATAAGRLLVAGIGVVAVAAAGPAPLALAVDLSPSAAMASLPAIRQYSPLDGWAAPLLSLDGTAASAPLKVALALRRWGL